MYTLKLKDFTLSVDLAAGRISSLILGGKERIAQSTSLFTLGVRKEGGELITLSASDANTVTETENGAIYSDFCEGISVRIFITDEKGEAAFRISATPSDKTLLIEWIDFPGIVLPPLRENGEGGGEILFPYNEGALISDINCREASSFRYTEPSYPSKGLYSVFPNMVCSQMLAYLFDDCGLYLGAHDPDRAVKGIDFVGVENGISLKLRLYCGIDPGESFVQEYPIILAAVGGNWESAAERYRLWFESALPPRAKKIVENGSLPEWYADSPLVVSYPIRGKWDKDEMSPNAFYPYTNALPLIEEVKRQVGGRVLALLMHWEGTAPWAPPYVWPPYGDLDDFSDFRDRLHENGDLLGVYCSGFGYTIQSNLVAEYNKSAEYAEKGLERGMCAGPDQKVEISLICQSQRSGYDICPASPIGRAILDEAYAPLFCNGLDYVQILDQNHGGGQYFCHSRDHGHPSAPGKWATKNMQGMLSDWNDSAKDMLFGCESAAAEPFIGNLLFSDNRYELNYTLGKAVPLYAYIYHEYLRNFMGNQVSCPFLPDADTLPYRIAYSFAAGDCMTLVFSPDGELMPNWGRPQYEKAPDKKKILHFCADLTRFYGEKAKPYLYGGRMTACPSLECDTVTFEKRRGGGAVTLPSVLCSAWQMQSGGVAAIAVNPDEKEITCKIGGRSVTIPPLDAVLVEFDKI